MSNTKFKGIIRYPNLFKASAPTGSDRLKFSVQLLIHKSDPQCVAITKMFQETEANGFPGGRPAGIFHECWKDCAISDPANEALKDYMALKASTREDIGRPPLVDSEKKPVIDPGVELVGKVGWISGSPNSYNKGSNGLGFYLGATLVTNETGAIPIGSLSSKPTIDQMFADVDAAPAVAPPAAPTTQRQMTAKAAGFTYESLIQQGWTDTKLIAEGYMAPPIPTSF